MENVSDNRLTLLGMSNAVRDEPTLIVIRWTRAGGVGRVRQDTSRAPDNRG